MMLKKKKTMEDYIQCPGEEGRVEGALCSKCGTNHTMTFEFYEQKVKGVIDEVALTFNDRLEKKDKLNVKDAVYIIELKKELGLK